MSDIKVLIDKGGAYGRGIARELRRCEEKIVDIDTQMRELRGLRATLQQAAVNVVGSCQQCENGHFPHCTTSDVGG